MNDGRTRKQPVANTNQPTVIPRSEHNISRANISANALKVLYRLRGANYKAYLVGGGVRDLLLGAHPKDFDVATEAHPEEVRAVFSNCRLIGRRFRLAHVLFGREIVEVATFRGEGADDGGTLVDENGRLLRDNVYGTMEQDAWRRDFTINALYYSIEDFAVYDYVGGMKDLADGVIRLIGDPQVRLREDPVRMLRAVRFAVKLGFSIEARVEQGIRELSGLLQDIAPARMFDEVLKLLMTGRGRETFDRLRDYGLFEPLFPEVEAVLRSEGENGPTLALLRAAMASTDARIAEDKPVTPAFLFAALLWGPVRVRTAALVEQGVNPAQAMQLAAHEVIDRAVQRVAIPRRFRAPMMDIWSMQGRFTRRQGARALALIERPRFRAAYDFLLLRGETGEVPMELADWWRRFQEADEAERNRMANPPGRRRGGVRRRRRKSR
jgi:poly(A) polymerase